MNLVSSPRTRRKPSEGDLGGRDRALPPCLDDGHRDRQVLDREPGRVEERDRLLPAAPARLAGEDGAEIGDDAAADLSPRDRARELAPGGRLLPLVAEE